MMTTNEQLYPPRIPVAQLAGSSHLAGKQFGSITWNRIENQIASLLQEPSVLAIDFSGIDVLTASFFASGFQGLWSRQFAIALVNAPPHARDEIEIALKAAQMRALFGLLEAGALVDVEPFNLDHIEAETYRQISAVGAATAGDLYRANRHVQPTAWSNRLAQLFRHRLLIKSSLGRQVRYAVCGRPKNG